MQHDLDGLWNGLETAIEQIITNVQAGFPTMRSMQLYTDVYNYCASSRPEVVPEGTSGAHLMGEEVYNRLRQSMEGHINTIAKECTHQHDSSVLDAYLLRWTRFLSSIQLINHIFNYLNRFWVARKKEEGALDVYDIRTLGLVLWRRIVFSPLRQRLRNAFLALVAADRQEVAVNKSVLRGVVASVVELGLKTLTLYRDEIEKPVLDASESFYVQESNELVSVLSPSEYALAVEQRLNSELQRARLYLYRDTEAELLKRCEKVLIVDHMDHLATDFVAFMDAQRNEDIHRVYSLLSRVEGGLEPLRIMFASRVKSVGLSEVVAAMPAAAEDPAIFCQTLLRVILRFRSMVDECFRKDPGFTAVLLKAANSFVNVNAVTEKPNAPKAADLVARYIDGILRQDNADSQSEVLDGTLQLFRLLEDKDIFQMVYSRRLAQRFINGLSTSEDAENAMLQRLKEVCGFDYTSRMQRMFSDMSTNRDLNEKFRNHPLRRNLSIDFSVLVLAYGSWPLQQVPTDVLLPHELESCVTAFHGYYKEHYSGRKLHWLHHVSRGDISFIPKPRARFVLAGANTFQITVLLQFNAESTRTFDQLQQATKFTPIVLTGTLISLVKSRVLQQVNPTAPADALSTEYAVNIEFKSKRLRVPMAGFSLEQRPDEAPAPEEVQDDRKLQIQAAVVRIMKARKQLEHNALISEVTTQLAHRFKPNIAAIKKSIELLIEKEYLERSKEDRSLYIYLS